MKPKVLMIAYACNPRGSGEHWLGWGWAEQAARQYQVDLITTPNHRQAVEERARECGITPHFVGLPQWFRSFSELLGGGGGWLRKIWWQYRVARLAQSLHRQTPFAVVHQTTFHTFRVPFLAANTLDIPSVWGPVAGGESVPKGFSRYLGAAGFSEFGRRLVNRAWLQFPPVKKSLRRVSVMFISNHTTLEFLPAAIQQKCRIVPPNALRPEDERPPTPPPATPQNSILHLLYVGNCVATRAIPLVFDALIASGLKDYKFTVVGNGPARQRWIQKAAQLGISDKVEFTGQVGREKLPGYYASADALVFPALRDSGGSALLEAMSRNLPVICLDWAGPGEMVDEAGGIKIPVVPPERTVAKFAEALVRIKEDPALRSSLAHAALQRAQTVFRWDEKFRLLQATYEGLIHGTFSEPNRGCSRADFLRALFHSLDANGIGYCVLRNYEGLLKEGATADLDLLVEGRDLDRFRECLQTAAEESGQRFVHYARYVNHSWVFWNAQSNFTRIDFDTEIRWRLFPILSARAVLEMRQRYDEHYIPHPAHESIVLFTQALWEERLRERYRAQLARLYDACGNKEELARTYREAFGNTGDELVEFQSQITKKEFSKAFCFALKRSLILKTFAHLAGWLDFIGNTISDAQRLWQRLRRPAGISLLYVTSAQPGKNLDDFMSRIEFLFPAQKSFVHTVNFSEGDGKRVASGMGLELRRLRTLFKGGLCVQFYRLAGDVERAQVIKSSAHFLYPSRDFICAEDSNGRVSLAHTATGHRVGGTVATGTKTDLATPLIRFISTVLEMENRTKVTGRKLAQATTLRKPGVATAKRLKVLLSAYACEPGKGSEPEVGWQWALQMARYHDVTVLTRTNNREAIEKGIETLQGKQPLPVFIYHDEGEFLLWLKKRFNTIRLYYILWQLSAWKIIARLNKENSFDLLHHVTFASFRYRTAIWNHGVPTVWGPVGGIQSIPVRLLTWRHPSSLILELFRHVNNFVQAAPFHALPRRALATTITLVSTQEMERTFLELGFKTTLMPTIGLQTSTLSARQRDLRTGPLRILFLGNIITLKGIDLAIEAMHAAGINATFTIVGDGNFKAAAMKLVEHLGMQDRVFFRGRVQRHEALQLYHDFDLFLYPTLHDTGGYAVIEAMFYGLPVVCLDCGGPRIAVKEGTGFKIPLGPRAQIIDSLADAIRKYDQNRDLLLEHSRATREIIDRDYDWEKKGLQLNAVYERATAKKPERTSATIPARSVDNRLRYILHRIFPFQGIAISVVILFCIGLAGFLSVNHLKVDAQLIVEDTLPGVSDAGAANAAMAESFNRTLLSLVAETPDERQRYRQELNIFSRRTAESLESYRESIFSEDDRANFNQLLERRKNFLQIREQILALIDTQKPAEALALYQNSLVPAYHEYKAAGEVLLQYNTRQGKSRGEAILKICTATEYAVAGVGLLLFVLGFLIGLFK